MTQKQMILAHMKEDGHEIKTEMECRKNRYGKKVHFARYRLA